MKCSDTKLQVVFSKDALGSRLYFGGKENKNFSSIGWKGQTNPDCSLKFEDIIGDEVNLEAEFPNSCGLTEHSDNDHIYYNQTIELTFGEDTGIITRQSVDHFHVSCYKNRTVQNMVNGNSFDVNRKIDKITRKSKFIILNYKLWLNRNNNIVNLLRAMTMNNVWRGRLRVPRYRY